MVFFSPGDVWDSFKSTAYIWISLASLVIYYSIPNTGGGKVLPGAPVVGAKSIFEPAWLTKLRFTSQGWQISHEGWLKVSTAMLGVLYLLIFR
jgi:hypothetical protein